MRSQSGQGNQCRRPRKRPSKSDVDQERPIFQMAFQACFWWGPLGKGLRRKKTTDGGSPAQRAKIGLKTDESEFVVVGLLRLDQGGYVGQFPNATLVAQDDEFEAAWWPDVGFSVYYIPGDFADTKKMNIIRLNGDLDLFDDGSVRVMRAPGHTPGSQFVTVKLPKTGTVILTSDVVYLKENLDKNLIPPIPGTVNPGDAYRSYQRVRLIRDANNAQIFYGHDPEIFKATKKAPEFYD